jgi:hypothetical protein
MIRNPTSHTLAAVLLSLFLFHLSPVLLAQRFVNGSGTCAGSPCYATIQAAINAAAAGETVTVEPGTYVENIVIAKGITLVSTGGRGSTIIQGTQTATPSVYGAILIEGSTSNVSIGTNASNGFTVLGVDWPTNVTDVGAIYVRGDTHTNLSMIGNDVRANGDNGFVLQYNTPVSGFTFSDNILSGQTYLGSQPNQTCGSSACYFDNTSSNVARSLFALNPGASNVTFTNNLITGSAGVGANGNTLVQFDANTALIANNTFAGSTVSLSAATNRGHLRVRGNSVSISCNTFSAAGLSGAGRYHIQMDQNANPLTGADPMYDTFAEIALLNNYDSNPVAYYNPIGALPSYQRSVFASSTDAGTYAAAGGTIQTVTGNCLAPLPVELAYFRGKPGSNGTAELSWQTAIERNNSHFEVERSTNAETFQAIGRVMGKGFSDHLNTYAFTDAAPEYGTNYYRLKQVDTDEKPAYSSIIGITIRNRNPLVVFPNPTADQITVRLTESADIESIGVYNPAGQLIRETKTATTVSMKNLPTGVYLVKIRLTDGRVYTKPVIRN